MRPPDRARMKAAVAEFLQAAGLDLGDVNLRETPERVMAAWADEFLDGYGKDPRAVLSDSFPAPGGREGELVVVTGLQFHSACPHHLLPYRGVAHVAYLPSQGRIVGLSKLARIVDVFAKRLQVQERMSSYVFRACWLIITCIGVPPS